MWEEDIQDLHLKLQWEFSLVQSELLKLIAGFWLSQALHVIDHHETLNDHKFPNLSFSLQWKFISFKRWRINNISLLFMWKKSSDLIHVCAYFEFYYVHHF